MLAQVLAVIIFVAMFIFIVTEIWERQNVTLVCGGLTLVLVFGVGMKSMEAVWSTLNLKSIFTLPFWYAAGAAETVPHTAAAEISRPASAFLNFFILSPFR